MQFWVAHYLGWKRYAGLCVLFFHACSKDTIWEFSLVITNTPHRHNSTLCAAERTHLWSASITKSGRGLHANWQNALQDGRRPEEPRTQIKDFDSSSNDLSLFPSISVLCLRSLSSITGTENNNAQTHTTPDLCWHFHTLLLCLTCLFRLLKQKKMVCV